MAGKTGDSEEDERILEIAIDLSNRLGIRFVPSRIVWMGTLGRVSDLPSDQCYFVEKGHRRGTMLMPAAAKGRLDPIDWSPLICSSLAYQFRREIRRVWRIIGGLVVATLFLAFLLLPLFLVFAFFGIFDLDSVPFLAGTLILIIILMILAFFLQQANRFLVLRKLHLKADTFAASVVGRDTLFRTLEKLDAMRIQDIEESKRQRQTIWKREAISSFPTLTARLANLQFN